MTNELIMQLREEAERLCAHSLDRGVQEAGIASNLANRAADALESAAVNAKREHYMRGYSDGFKEGHAATVTDAMVKRATQEFLSHKGDCPELILRGGYTLWEVNAPAMRAALTAVKKMQPPAGETIRSTQDGSMEGASVTAQSAVDASSPSSPICGEDR